MGKPSRGSVAQRTTGAQSSPASSACSAPTGRACAECAAAAVTAGLWRCFDPACLHCGARLIQQLGKLQIPPTKIKARRAQVLADWLALGHDETTLRALAKSAALVVG